MAVVKNLMVRAGADFSEMVKGISIGKNSLKQLQSSAIQSVKSISNSTKQAQQSMKSMQSGVSSAIGKIKATIATIGIGALVNGSKNMAMQTEASIQQINRAMNVHSKEFLQWANTQALSFNMARSEATQYGAVYGNLISSFEGDTKKVTQYTTNLLKASAVVASGTGRSMEDVMERIRSGMLGNTESIEDLGINVNIAMIESTNAFKKFAGNKSWQQLDFQTQQQIRLFAILEQSSKKYGDSINQNTASAQQQFIARLKNIQLLLGQAFLPVYNVILPALSSLTSGIESAVNVFAQFTQALFGSKQQKNTVATTQAQASAVGDVGDAYKEAGKAAKGALAGFDEINNLADNSDSSSSAGASTKASAPRASTEQSTLFDNVTVSPKIQQIADNLKTMFKPVTTAFENLKASAEPLINTIGNALGTFYSSVLVPFGTWTINEAIPSFMNLLGGAFTVINPLLQAFNPLAGWLWTSFLQPIASWTGEAFIAAINSVAGALKSIGEWMSANKPIVEGITIAMVAFIAAWKLTELLAFVQMSGGIVGAFNAIRAAIAACTIAKLADKAETVALTLMYAKDFVVSIAASTAALATQAWQWVAATVAMGANKIALVASTIAQWAMVAATTAWNIICGIGTVLTTAFGVAMAILTSPITLVILAIAALVAGVYLLITHWDDVKKAAGVAWDWIVGVWTVASTWFNDNVVQPIATAFKSVWDGITGGFTKAFELIKTGIKAYVNFYISIVEGFVNMFIKGINLIISGLNKISFNVPDWVPVIGGKNFGFNMSSVSEISLPRLAEGGITNGPMHAIIGDNPGGREVVSPLDKLQDIIAGAVGTAVMNAMQLNQGNGSGGDVILQIDGTVLARALNPYSSKESSRIGGSMILTT